MQRGGEAGNVNRERRATESTEVTENDGRRRPPRRSLPWVLLCALCALCGLVSLLSPLSRAADDAAFNEGKRALEQAIRDKDAARAREACGRIAQDAGERAAKALIAVAPAAREIDFYDALLEALQSFAEKKAVEAILDAANEHRDWTVRYIAVEALGGIEQDGCRKAVFAAFDDKHESVAACAMKICRARRWKTAVTPLIDRLERLEKKDPESRLLPEATRALEGITGKSFSSGGDWRRWWAENEKSFTPPGPGGAGAGGGEDGVITRVRDRGEYDFIEKLEKGDVLVVKGASDQCEDVLDALKIPYTLLERDAAKKKLATLDPRSVLVYNCEGDIENGGVRGDDAKALATFVDKGGYLFTSDWALEEEVIPAFPGILSVVNQMETEIEVKIGPAKGTEKLPLLRDVFPDNPFAAAKMKWKIDNLAETFRCAPGKAQPLVESQELAEKGGGSPTVAAYFRSGKGAVLHVLGHFHMQKDEAGGDGFALQQLLVNFIVEKQKFRAGKAGKKKGS